MPSLAEAQRRFAHALFAAQNALTEFRADRLAVYRANVRWNYRNALTASFPVVKRLVGAPFFHAAVDAYVAAHPSRSGDLNRYGDRYGQFLSTYAPAASLPYLPDTARLEWALDEAQRAAEAPRVPPAAVLAALAMAWPDRVAHLRLRLDPTCRLVASPFPILRIWQANQPSYAGGGRVSLDDGGDALLVRRDTQGTSIERLARGDHAWLAAVAAGATLDAALDAAQRVDAGFDLGTVLREQIGAATIVGVTDA